MTIDGKKVWRIFPGLETAAYYDPLGNYICLNNLSQAQLKQLRNNPADFPKEHSILMHEFQHWIDHISTLWGQKKLKKIFRAFDSFLSKDEHQFYRMKEVLDDFKRDRLFDYYTTLGALIQGDERRQWRYQLSAGAKFNMEGKVDNQHSIVFVRFNSYKDEFISRVPLSVASLLETTARRMELEIRLLHILQLKEPFRTVELKSLNDDLVRHLYHPELTLYSVAVHACSNLLHINDPIVGYRIASEMATLALNFPFSLLSRLKIPLKYEGWGKNYPQNMIAQQEYGFLFLCLIQNYADAYGDYRKETFTIEAVLAGSGLPNLTDFENLVEEESKSIGESVALEQNVFTNMVFDKIFTGNQIRHVRGVALQKSGGDVSFMNNLKEYPYLICNDQLVIPDGVNFTEAINKVIHVEPISPEEWWCIFETCERKISEFSEICGI